MSRLTNPKKRTVPAVPLALLLSLLALPLLTPQTRAAPPTQAGNKLVLAFYYMWFGPADFAGGQMSDTPTAPYDSSKPEVIERQVREARGAGIDGFIAAWTGAGTPTDDNFTRLLDIAAANDFKATIYFETQIIGRASVQANLQAALGKYASHPAFLRWDGKPVIFFWSPQSYGNASAWRTLRKQVDPNNAHIWSVDTTDKTYLDAFDTIHFFSAGKWNANTNVAQVHAQWRGIVDQYNKANGTKRIWTAGVTPGWDESRMQPPRSPAKVFPRRDGALYEEAWKGATASNPEWITITSYNEWFEGTQIEPSATYGNRYLDLTRQFAGAWKNEHGPCDGGTYFPQTRQGICKQMEGYWQKYGGLAQFGYPISGWAVEASPTDGKQYTVQYFERARFELHPENRGTPYEVLLSQLGAFEYARKYPNGAPNQRQNREAGKLFPETSRWVGGAFLRHWEKHGGLFVNGYPISDEFTEQAPDGKQYTVQYFERARFEFHPENPAPNNVLLGLLGRQAWEQRSGR
ncbi:MAG: glycoside hydrolase family 99-like domain-containing protein [Chloroflexota bacterium]|nr:glycoside hydrolase family 99-like domain-containing protein [Chloroflexota bacterium]